MPSATIDRLIVNSPYEEPARHWRYDRATRLFHLDEGRRPAGYVVASGGAAAFDDPGVFREIPLVNRIRERVKAWRESGHPGVTGITKRLLEHWNNPDEFESRRFFFCQLEAAETLIWITEAPPSERVGIDIPSDGGAFKRLCAKMATGSGKTVVMAMVIAWHVLNKVANPRDVRFAKNILVVAPGLTVRSRLAVLKPSHPENYYEEFRVVPPAMRDKLRRGKVVIRNWHALNWETEERITKKRGVDKRGPKSDAAYVRDVLGEMASARNLLVINDEAHHAWRVPAGGKVKGVLKNTVEEATKWVGGLDRIHRARGVLACYDFSATPFVPSGKQSSEDALFGWIVSDFGLNDAIESGLVKTPRVVIRDDAVPDAKTYKSRLYHIYQDPEVKDDLNRRAKPEEPLPDLVTNGYYLLGYDWKETAKEWKERGSATPPVMITVANRTETAARIKHAFDRRLVHIEELCDPERTLHIDSKVLAAAEAAEEPIAEIWTDDAETSRQTAADRKLTRKQRAELLRRQVDTVGRPNRPGERIQNVISVGMLSEGWDAKTVTHIMGLRAFTSQLLCEQVTGRALRRSNYDNYDEDGRLVAEYAEVIGVPFEFMPVKRPEDDPAPPKPRYEVHSIPGRRDHRIEFPNVEHYLTEPGADGFRLNPDRVIKWKPKGVKETVLEGSVGGTKTISAEASVRRQQALTRLAADLVQRWCRRMDDSGEGRRARRRLLFHDAIRIVKTWTDLAKVTEDHYDGLGSTSRDQAVKEIDDACETTGGAPDRLVAAFGHPLLLDTSSVKFETSLSARRVTKKSELNIAACHSQFERACARALDKHPDVVSWARNFRLGWTVPYLWEGTWHRYEPDFVARLFADREDEDAVHLIIECKGVPDDHSERKKQAVTTRWVPAVQSSGQLPAWLRRWAFVELDEPDLLSADLNTAIKAARAAHPETLQQGAA